MCRASAGIRLDVFSAGCLSLVVFYAAYLSETFRAAISGVHQGQTEAAEALWLGRVGIFTHVVFPQALRLALPGTNTMLVDLLKSTSLLVPSTAAPVCRDLARLRRTVGMVFQRFHLFPHLTAVENVVLAQRKAGVPEREALERAVALLRRVGLAHRGLAFPEQMSGGEQQRVAIARALALKPEVLLFDEPTSSLDPESTREVLRVMRELAADGMTMMLVTHELPFAREVSDHVVFVDGGRIVEQGTPDEVLGDPSQARTRAFLTSYGSDANGGNDANGVGR
jgi:ABC-type polar amino acid transport system ATPase subunit